jgi:alpha-L-fucosidase 2
MIKDLAEKSVITAKPITMPTVGCIMHRPVEGNSTCGCSKIWNVAGYGTWLCQHIWEHYLFTGDVEFLREYYPIMKGAARSYGYYDG